LGGRLLVVPPQGIGPCDGEAGAVAVVAVGLAQTVLRQQEAGGEDGLAIELLEQWEHPGLLDLGAAAHHEKAAALLCPPQALGVGDAGRVELVGGGDPGGLVAAEGEGRWGGEPPRHGHEVLDGDAGMADVLAT